MSANNQTTSSASWLFAAALIALVALLAAPTLTAALDDTTTQQNYHAARVAEVVASGPGALGERVEWWLSERQNRASPSPLRVLPTLAGAAWERLFGASPRSLAWLSLSAHLVLIAVQFAFARKHLGVLAAFVVAALTAFAPAYLGSARLAVGQSITVLCQVASAWLFCEAMRDPQRWRWRVLFTVAFTLALLSSEFSLLLIASFTLVIWIGGRQERARAPIATWIALLAAPVVAASIVALAVAGDWSAFARAVKQATWVATRNLYVSQREAGPWFEWLLDELLTSPVPTLLGLAGLALIASRSRSDDADPIRVHVAVIYLSQVVALSLCTRVIRNTALLEAFSRTLAAVFLCDVIAARRTLAGRVALIASVVLLCWADWRDFQRIFVARGIEEPTTAILVDERQIVKPLSTRSE